MADKMDAVADLRGPVQPGRDPCQPPAESRARRRQAVRALRAMAQARSARARHAELGGLLPTSSAAPASILRARERALYSDRPGHQPCVHGYSTSYRRSVSSRSTFRGCMNACGHTTSATSASWASISARGVLTATSAGRRIRTRRSATGSFRLAAGRGSAAIRKIVDAYLRFDPAERALPRYVPARRHRAVQGGVYGEASQAA